MKVSPASALYLTGFASFVGFYLPQPILPLVATDYGVTAQSASLVISATILGIALASPFVSLLAQKFAAKHLLLTSSLALTLITLASAFAPAFGLLVTLRFVQGLLLAILFAVSLSYVSESLPNEVMAGVAGRYVATTILGGMLGRILAGTFGDVLEWRYGFVLSALLYLVLVPLWLAQPKLKASAQPRGALGSLEHLKNPAILAGLAIGFFLFFAFQATTTYLPFKLAAPPFDLSTTVISLMYLSYAAGMVSSGLAGWLRRRFSLRLSFALGFGLALFGNLGVLTNSLTLTLAALLVLCFGNWIVQGLAVGYVATATQTDRAGANALYLLFYYLGGSLGAYLPGLFFEDFGYSGVIVTSIVALMLGLGSALFLLRPMKGN